MLSGEESHASHWVSGMPGKVTIDKSGASAAALNDLNEERKKPGSPTGITLILWQDKCAQRTDVMIYRKCCNGTCDPVALKNSTGRTFSSN